MARRIVDEYKDMSPDYVCQPGRSGLPLGELVRLIDGALPDGGAALSHLYANVAADAGDPRRLRNFVEVSRSSTPSLRATTISGSPLGLPRTCRLLMTTLRRNRIAHRAEVVTTMSSGERSHSIAPTDKTAPDDTSAASSQPLPAESTTESAPSQQDEETRRYEALAQRITDTYARFTPKDMELLKALGWG
jgi:hypothetical protein